MKKYIDLGNKEDRSGTRRFRSIDQCLFPNLTATRVRRRKVATTATQGGAQATGGRTVERESLFSLLKNQKEKKIKKVRKKNKRSLL